MLPVVWPNAATENNKVINNGLMNLFISIWGDTYNYSRESADSVSEN